MECAGIQKEVQGEQIGCSHREGGGEPADPLFSTTELQDKLSSQAQRCLNPEEKYMRKFPTAAHLSAAAGSDSPGAFSRSEAKTGLQEMIAKLIATGNSGAARSKFLPNESLV